MSRTHRLFDLLQILRRHRKPVSGAVLAAETGISLRTLYRDIAALQAMGAEVDGEPGIGYVLRPGFMLPPLMFSDAELQALALGARWVARRTDRELSGAAADALAKIAAVLPDDLRRRLEDEVLLVGHGWVKSQAVGLEILRRALNQERRLAVIYRDEKGTRTERVVWPVVLGFFESTRVLAAWCELRNGFRHFRADRIEGAEILADRTPRSRRVLLREWRETMLPKTDSVSIYTSSPKDTPTETTMSKDLVLFTNPQSRGNVVHWMLEEIGAPYRLVIKEYGTSMKAPDYLAVNPMGKVPALLHGDTVITETAAILAYLADAFPEAELAPPTAERGDYYRWMFFAAGCLEPAISNHSVGWDPATPDMQGRFGYGSYGLVLDTLAAVLRDRHYIAAGRFTAADIHLASMLNWGMRFGVVEKRPEFQRYCEGLVNRSAARRAWEQAEKLTAAQAWAKS